MLFWLLAWEVIGLGSMAAIRLYGLPTTHRHQRLGWKGCFDTCRHDVVFGRQAIEVWAWLLGGFIWPVWLVWTIPVVILRGLHGAISFIGDCFELLGYGVMFVLRFKI